MAHGNFWSIEIALHPHKRFLVFIIYILFCSSGCRSIVDILFTTNSFPICSSGKKQCQRCLMRSHCDPVTRAGWPVPACPYLLARATWCGPSGKTKPICPEYQRSQWTDSSDTWRTSSTPSEVKWDVNGPWRYRLKDERWRCE